jgi:hypothetical protein
LSDGTGTGQIQQKYYHSPEFTKLPGDVRSPGITAEKISRITLAQDFK